MCSTISKGTFALIGLTDRSTYHSVDAFCRTFHMPYVTTSAPPSHALHPGGSGPPAGLSRRPQSPLASTREAGGYTLYMRPMYERAVADVIRYYSWERVFYVYDANDGKETL